MLFGKEKISVSNLILNLVAEFNGNELFIIGTFKDLNSTVSAERYIKIVMAINSFSLSRAGMTSQAEKYFTKTQLLKIELGFFTTWLMSQNIFYCPEKDFERHKIEMADINDKIISIHEKYKNDEINAFAHIARYVCDEMVPKKRLKDQDITNISHCFVARMADYSDWYENIGKNYEIVD